MSQDWKIGLPVFLFDRFVGNITKGRIKNT